MPLPQALDLIAEVMQERRFGAAALALVNGLVAQLACTQAALGWSRGGYVRAVAISHMDRFEAKTENVQQIEAALEEAIDQEQDIHYPQDQTSPKVVLAHAQLQRTLGCTQLWSLPLWRGSEPPVAALLIVSQEDDLDHSKIDALHTAIGLLLPWLNELRAKDRWWRPSCPGR